MIPSGGFSIIIHALINIVFWLWHNAGRMYRAVRPWIARIILVLMVGIVLFAASRLLMYAFSGETNADILSDVLNPCNDAPRATTTPMVVIRLDDVQAFSWADVAIRMMDDARERDIPLVLGVIPLYLKDDQRTYAYLRSQRCFHEIAQHGWDHGAETGGVLPEFHDTPYEEALKDISAGAQILTALAREQLTTFIPPNNEMSPDARRALDTVGIPVVSSAGTGRYDFDATSFDYVADVITSPEQILADCERAIAKDGLCVVMLHPQEFATDGKLDPQKYDLYVRVLDELQARQYSFVRFKDLVAIDREYASWKHYVFPFLR